MKFHLALAGLALIWPFTTAADHETGHSGINLSPLDVVMEKGEEADNLQLALDAIAQYLSPEDRRLAHNDFCGQGPTRILRENIPCGGFLASFPDPVLFDLHDGFIYTFKVHRVTCDLDPVTQLFGPLVAPGVPGQAPEVPELVAKSDDVNARPDSCLGTDGDFLDPEIVYEATEDGGFFLVTSPFGVFSGCPHGGYAYEIEISCAEAPPGGGGGQGDPHFKTWRGQHFDYHGECDLVLLHNAEFESGLGLDVHIRTEIRRDMAYIASAALRIGEDVLEVASQGVYWLNGVLNADLSGEFSGFAFSHTQPNDKQHVFEVYLGGRERIKVKTYKDFVSVLIEQGKREHFLASAGLMGDYRAGRMIARDGKTVIDDANVFGQEWQVLNSEPSLFQTARFPQHPNVCTMPTPVQASQLRRRLSESSFDELVAAEKACEHWGEGKDDCVFDVLTTGDLAMAMVGAY
jgi:hypothetical protein